jgi:hypothetical protein
MSDALTITGLKETQTMMIRLAADIGAGLEPALQAASRVIEQELFENIPRSKKGHDDKSKYPPLASSLVTDIRIRGTFGVASVGFGDAGQVALWNEYGHRIVAHSGMDSGKKTQPRPFMRRSADNAADRAIDAFAESFAATLR